MNNAYVVCETTAAMTYHIRPGYWQPCGKQTTLTLCELKPSWDTHIPIPDFDKNIERGWCSECLDTLRKKLWEKLNLIL